MLTLRVILLLAAGITAAAASSEFTLKCLVTYLRADNVSEPLFSHVESVGNFTECSNLVSSIFDRLYERFRSSQRFYDCMKTSLNSSGLKTAYILTEAVDRLDVGWKVWKKSKKKEKNQELHTFLNTGLKVAQEACHETGAKEDIAAEFDRTVRDSKNKTFTETQAYCVKKHLISLGILDSNAYNSTFLPKSIDPDAGNCDSVISTLQENSYREMLKHISDCIVDSYRHNYLIEQYMKIEYVLAQIDLTPVEMSFERDRFVQTVFTIMKKARKACSV